MTVLEQPLREPSPRSFVGAPLDFGGLAVIRHTAALVPDAVVSAAHAGAASAAPPQAAAPTMSAVAVIDRNDIC
ncbi:hypothetical protein [Actinophytocola oryzae]|uniref:hypothetical protein n=1 Tax=Actinophytocola oryzae TaxID=502181 RepID=UPI0010635255|nr:hypothetical protein [Actinophytocola oryzae]